MHLSHWGYNFEILNLHLGRKKNIHLINAALGSTESDVMMRIPLKKTGAMRTWRGHIEPMSDTGCGYGFKEQDVRVIALDDYVRENSIPSVDFIKADVKGVELMVFKGAKNVISLHKPVIMAEIEGRWTERYGHKPDDVIEFLKNRGYDSHKIVWDANPRKTSLTATNRHIGKGDYLFLPKPPAKEKPHADLGSTAWNLPE